MRSRLIVLLGVVLTATSVTRLAAWDYEGHRAVNQLALASLPPEFPAFVRSPEARERIAFLSGEADRWRNVRDLPLRHANGPEHFIDFEDLEPVGIAPADLPDMRQVFASRVAAAHARHPDRFPKYDRNEDRTKELVGYLPWTITEYSGKLKSAFSYLKVFEELGTPEEIANAQANVIYLMGLMGHYVGDGAQPLHTTKHFNGWVGDNPERYTTSKGFHAWIDGGFINRTGGLSVPALEQRVKPARVLGRLSDPAERNPIFVEVLGYLRQQFAKVEPLYQLDKAGKLNADKPGAAEGKAFLEEQIVEAGHMLGSLWLTAWKDAPPDTYLRGALVTRKTRREGN